MFESTEWDLFKMWNSQCDGWWPVICRCSRSVDTTQVRYQWKLSFQCYSLEVLTCMLRSIVQCLKQCFGGTACKFSCLRKSPNKIFGMDHSDAKPVLLLYTIIRIFFQTNQANVFLWYTLFIVLYPIGVTGELLCIYRALPIVWETDLFSLHLPNKWNFSFEYYFVLVGTFPLYRLLRNIFCPRCFLNKKLKIFFNNFSCPIIPTTLLPHVQTTR